MDLERRTVLTGLGAFAVTASPISALARASATVGDYELISLSDGNLVLPGSFFFDGLPQDELTRILALYNIVPDQLEPPCNVSLLQHADRTVLFDAGAGPAFMPSAGTLLESLDTVGVAPDDVTHIVFTHAHPDHLWGVLDDFDDEVFANAEYMIGQAEWDYWRDPDTVNSIGEARAAFAVGANRRLEVIEDRVSFFRDGEEILPGIMAHASFGHTPGHMCFEVRDGTEAVMIGGDAIGNHHVAFARPDWTSGADQDRELAARTRARLLDKLAHDQTPLMGFHLPGGGIGRVERKDGAYLFVESGQ